MNYDDPAWLQEQYENLRDDINAYEFGDYEVEFDDDAVYDQYEEDSQNECTF